MDFMLPAVSSKRLLVDSLRDALSVFAPTDCAGCGIPDRALCEGCRSSLGGSAIETTLSAASAPLTVTSWADYAGVVRQILLSFKDGGRTDSARALSDPLRKAIAVALSAAGRSPDGRGRSRIELATIPSSRAAFRRRGYHPVALVLAQGGLRSAGLLRPSRQTEDQVGLNLSERAENRANSLKTRVELGGRRFLIVDDILTTGTTILEARRALEAAGGVVAGAATIAVTRRRNDRRALSGDPPQIHDDNPVPRVYGCEKGVDDPPFVIRASNTSHQGGRHGTKHHRTQPGHHRPLS